MGVQDLTLSMVLIVAVGVFLASFMDAIAGGGGIISVPTYLLAGLPMHVALFDHLLMQEGHVDEAAAHIGKFLCDVIEHAVHQMVADVGPRRVGYGCRDAGLAHFLHHGLDGQRGKIGRVSVLKDRRADGLIALVVRDAGVVHVDRDALRRDTEPAARLTDAQCDIRLFRLHGLVDGGDRFPEHHGDVQLDDLCPRDGVLDHAHGLLRGIDRFAAKGIKRGDKDPHKWLPPCARFCTAGSECKEVHQQYMYDQHENGNRHL